MRVSFQELSGVTRLYSDYLYSFERLSQFYNGDFHSPSAFGSIQKQVQSETYPRAELVKLLLGQNQQFGAPQKTLHNIKLLQDKNTCVVFTGQQIGLFGGPLYTIYKSLTAIKLCQKLSEELNVKVIPIFWMATDDHDWAEINHLYFADSQKKLVKLEYQSPKDWNGWPAAQIVLDENIKACLQILAAGISRTSHTDRLLKTLSECYSAGQPFYVAFARWMSFLLGKYGLIIFNPADPQFKSLVKPVFEAELAKNGSLQNLIEETSRNLESENYHRQVHKKTGLTNLFYHTPKRMHISKDNGKFIWEGEKNGVEPSRVVKLLQDSPQSFSANVLLRPLLENFAFPSLARVAGPSEIAYFAQIKALYNELGVVMPVIYPRKSLTLVEPEVKKMLDKYEIAAVSILKDVEQAYNSLIEKKVPGPITRLLEQTQAQLKSTIASLREEVLKVQPGLKQNLEFTQGKIDFEFNKFKEKFFQAYKKQFKEIKADLYTTRDFLHPQNTLQERIFNISHFINGYGFDLVDYLYQNLELDNFDHQILELNER